MVEIPTVSLVDSVLIDQSDANCILSAVLNHSDLTNSLFSIDVYGLFADNLMEVAIVLDLLYSQIVDLELGAIEVILTPKIIVLEDFRRNNDLGLDRLEGSFATYKAFYLHIHTFLRRL